MAKVERSINMGFKIVKGCLPGEKRHFWNKATRVCWKCEVKFEDATTRIKRPYDPDGYAPTGRPVGRPLGSRNRNLHQGLTSKGVVEARNENPCATLQQIGNKFGVTRERVRQILKRDGLETRHFRQHYLCNHCRKVIIGNRGLKPKFCSRVCRSKYYDVELICDGCGKSFIRKIHNIRIALRRPMGGKEEKLWFCGYGCHGLWLAENYGFNKFPEHAKYSRSRKEA